MITEFSLKKTFVSSLRELSVFVARNFVSLIGTKKAAARHSKKK